MSRLATVLLVEDDRSILDGMADLLHLFDIGYDVQALKATNGVEGLALMQRHTPDLIISDIMMPKMNGFEFMARIRENPSWVHIPVVFLTAKGKKQDILEGRRSGAELYITKPFVSEELLELVKSQLDRAFQLQEARQERIDTLKRNLLQLLNHEFRTPLTYVTAYYDMLADSIVRFEDPSNLQEYLRGIQVGCVRLNGLLEDLIRIMEIRTGEAAEAFARDARPIDDIGDLLYERGEAAVSRASQFGIQIEYEIEDRTQTIIGERAALAEAIDRLLDNAIKFTASKQAEQKQILLRCANEVDEVQISVIDTGIGFPPHVQKQLFDLFYQYNRERLEQQGSGTGLAIAKGLVDLHDGRIEAESEPGEGSIFSIFLPATQKERTQRTAAGGRQATILAVEDDETMLNGLKELLELSIERYQVRVLTAFNGNEALEMLEKHQPDLILSDIMMPEMGGYELLDQVRANPAWVHIPFIFLTALNDKEEIHRGRRSGAEEFFTKPYDLDELLQLTETQLDRHFQRLGATTQGFEALKRSILGMLQPDFKDPLDLVTQYSQKLADDLQSAETDEELVSSLHGIQASSERLSRLVEDFITVAEFKTGEAAASFKLRATPVANVGAVLYEAAYGYEFTADHFSFSYDLSRDLPPVLCDRERLFDALQRLVDVLVEQRSQEKGRLHFLSRSHGGQAILAIDAVGVSFPQEAAEAIVEFLGTDSIDVLELPHLGPRLTVVKNVFSLHDGSIRLKQGQHRVLVTMTLPTHAPSREGVPSRADYVAQP